MLVFKVVCLTQPRPEFKSSNSATVHLAFAFDFFCPFGADEVVAAPAASVSSVAPPAAKIVGAGGESSSLVDACAGFNSK